MLCKVQRLSRIRDRPKDVKSRVAFGYADYNSVTVSAANCLGLKIELSFFAIVVVILELHHLHKRPFANGISKVLMFGVRRIMSSSTGQRCKTAPCVSPNRGVRCKRSITVPLRRRTRNKSPISPNAKPSHGQVRDCSLGSQYGFGSACHSNRHVSLTPSMVCSSRMLAVGYSTALTCEALLCPRA